MTTKYALISLAIGLQTFAQAAAGIVYDPEGYNHGDYGPVPNTTYVSSDLKAPIWQVNTWKPDKVDQTPKHIFMDFFGADEDTGPKIFSTHDLSLVYSHPAAEGSFNARVQKYKGKDYLTYWAGTHNGAAGSGSGYCYFLNNRYQLAYTIAPIGLQEGVMTDQHECQMTEDDTVLISVYQSIPNYDLTSVGGPANGTLLDSGFQEIDIATNKTVVTWWASDHFDISDSYVQYDQVPSELNSKGFDFFHLNSVQKIKKNFLVSGRLCRVVTYIDHADGKPIWTLGGKVNQFQDLSNGKALSFGYQHHARFHDESMTQLTMFDNHGFNSMVGCESNCSRGLHLELDQVKKTARVISESYHPQSLVTGAEGSFQVQKNGNALVGWGTNPSFTEVTEEGELAWDVQYGPWYTAQNTSETNGNYRVFKDNWVGYPTWDPDIAAKDGNVYVSWNGATEVEFWDVYIGNSSTKLSRWKRFKKTGFETMIKLETTRHVQVKALDRRNKPLGATKILAM
ncbi:hypothetical protein NW762_013926 [Fusarium torreyae]|uniref:Arylsulfotransferase n=1 Tax=Fusarium torreyae TaxID=1237075 RepID=A0A9W8RL57_9HYPO|nr:hypothetical protein NW762_013926 [Fusarium torreyae]